jgi:two-component system sensor histidine kinase VicK
MKYLLEQRNLSLDFDIPEEFWINIDKNRIGEVITNLLSNAIKCTPPYGKISIKLHEQDDWAILSVSDTGVGLTEKEMRVLFTRFGKIDRHNEGLEYIDIKGSGLGLYICKEILKLHGGEIWAQSDGRNKGSTFVLKLPFN